MFITTLGAFFIDERDLDKHLSEIPKEHFLNIFKRVSLTYQREGYLSGCVKVQGQFELHFLNTSFDKCHKVNLLC